jgi:hypothetical protein
MAKKFIDLAVGTAIDDDSIALGDGTALTLTNKVRVLYDDALSKHEIEVLLKRAAALIRKLEPA